MIDLNIHEVTELAWDKTVKHCKVLVVTTNNGTTRIALFPVKPDTPPPPPSENDDEPNLKAHKPG